jgi:oligoribonuclease NrnB/cAMP/cGMP phosphodiesterase (DHH superfamily)
VIIYNFINLLLNVNISSKYIITKMKPHFDTCYYHRGCSDGTCAAWVVRREYPNIQFIGIQPNSNIRINSKTGKLREDIKETTYAGKEVIFVDVCPQDKLLKKMSQLSKRIVILDHHKTNRELIKTFDTQKSVAEMETIFDMSRAGCQLAWDYIYKTCNSSLFRPYERLWFVDYIADRDLWTWQMNNSKFINNALFELGYSRSFEGFDELYSKEIEVIDTELLPFAKAVDIKNKNTLERCVRNAKWCRMNVNGTFYNVWAVSTYDLLSEVGNYLSTYPHKNGDGTEYKVETEILPDFVVIWRYNFEGNEWWISLRASAESNHDVSSIAKQMDPGGGGHPKAAGFTFKSDTNKQIHDFLEII